MLKPYLRFPLLVLLALISSLAVTACGEDTPKTNQLQATIEAQATQIAQLRGEVPTVVPTATPSGVIATIQADATALAKPTSTVGLNNTPTTQRTSAQATATAAQATFTVLESSARRIFDPQSGKFTHNGGTDLNYFGIKAAKFNNFQAVVKFYNPYSAQDGKWSAGFIFRSITENDGGTREYQIYISSDRTWICEVVYYTKDDDFDYADTIASGIIRDLDVTTTGSNQLSLIVNRDTAILKVNNKIVDAMKLPDSNGRSPVSIAEGFNEGEEILGKVTKYEGFSVYDLGE